MPAQLAHLGEDIVHAIVRELGIHFLSLCGGFEKHRLSSHVALKEVPLEPYGGLSFDGASRIDMLVLLEEGSGIPFEIKLGSTRLSKSRIEDEWLCGCKASHGNTRWSGNMLSILERRFHPVPESTDLYARASFPGRTQSDLVRLTREWFLIAREHVIEAWMRPGARPQFSDRCQLISFESIVSLYEKGAHCSGENFNALIGRLLTFNYYDHWIRKKSD
jgi:hypothetical protein